MKLPSLKKTLLTTLTVGGVGAAGLAWCWRTPKGALVLADAEYEKLTAGEKVKVLYKRCQGGGEGRWGTVAELTHFLVIQTFGPSFTYLSDEMYPGQFKGIHTIGCVAEGVFESTGDHPFTGVFASKANPVLIRTSRAGPPEDNVTIPGLAVKFLRDGHPSVNTFALKSFEGIEGGNYFNAELSNHLPQPKKVRDKIVQGKFERFSAHATMLGLSEFAQRNQDGSKVPDDAVRFPFQLIFTPNPSLATIPVCQAATWQTPLKNLMDEVPSGTKLFDVKAIAEPGDEPKLIGTFKTLTPLIASEYGDTKLFFRHHKMNDDLALRPEWEEVLRKNGE